MTRSKAIEQWMTHSINFDWVSAEVVKDAPSKVKDRASKEEHLNFQLLTHLEKPSSSVEILFLLILSLNNQGQKN